MGNIKYLHVICFNKTPAYQDCVIATYYVVILANNKAYPFLLWLTYEAGVYGTEAIEDDVKLTPPPRPPSFSPSG